MPFPPAAASLAVAFTVSILPSADMFVIVIAGACESTKKLLFDSLPQFEKSSLHSAVTLFQPGSARCPAAACRERSTSM
ncbi:Uncharacterised protein [Candidatus Anstonella stagnisolia]|nr:Uncharacterised protein [Candidatus Anstonella stagnisolia]